MSTRSRQIRLRDCVPSTRRFDRLAGIIAHYRANHQKDADRELEFFRIQRNFESAIQRAGLARGPGGKRFSHQRRLPESVLKRCEQNLQGVREALLRARSFDRLHEIVESEIGSI